jgi:hyperosmotically inducible periplasmic protein
MRKHISIAVLVLSGLVLAGCASQAEQMVDDAALTAKVKARIAAQASINALKINVDVRQNVVTLTGEVPTEAEKTQAGQLAQATEGVKSVVNNLTINPNALGSSTVKEKAKEATQDVGREAGEALTDAAILTKIKAQFVSNGIVGTDVDVSNGEVTLRGTVNNEAERQKAETVARQTGGVTAVKNMLLVKQG